MSENLQKFIGNPVSVEQKPFVLEKIVRQFAEKNNSAETRRTYTAYLKKFFSFVKVINAEQALRVNSDDVIARREALKTQGRSANTVRTKLAAVRSFYEHLRHLGLIERNPASVFLVPPPKVGNNPKRRALTPLQVRRRLELLKKETISGKRAGLRADAADAQNFYARLGSRLSLREEDFYYNRNCGM